MAKYIASSLLLAYLLAIYLCSADPDLAQDEDQSSLNKVLQILLGQLPPDNANGTSSHFKKFALDDNSNEDIATSTPQEIIARSGFGYENHYVLARDGYITQLIRLINPKVRRTHLRWPPVMLMHGGINDPTAYVWSSAIQHHPESWPRRPQDGPFTSWNRSLAFTLCNNGFDVWLVGTRGCNEQNQGHINSTSRSSKTSLTDTSSYWDYSMDEIVQHELPRQIDKVLRATGARNVTLWGFSFSSQITLSMLSSNELYASKVHSYICVAPLINIRGSSWFSNATNWILLNTPESVGTALVTKIAHSSAARQALRALTSSKEARYSLGHALYSAFAGPSHKYQVFLEDAVIGHLLITTGFREMKHWAQQVAAGRLQRFDYGFFENELVYHQGSPPVYDLSNIRVHNWMLISCSNDILSPPESAKQLLQTVQPKPKMHLNIEGYNHLDPVVAIDNDIQVVLPVVRFLQKHAYPSSRHKIAKDVAIENERLKQFVSSPE